MGLEWAGVILTYFSPFTQRLHQANRGTHTPLSNGKPEAVAAGSVFPVAAGEAALGKPRPPEIPLLSRRRLKTKSPSSGLATGEVVVPILVDIGCKGLFTKKIDEALLEEAIITSFLGLYWNLLLRIRCSAGNRVTRWRHGRGRSSVSIVDPRRRPPEPKAALCVRPPARVALSSSKGGHLRAKPCAWAPASRLSARVLTAASGPPLHVAASATNCTHGPPVEPPCSARDHKAEAYPPPTTAYPPPGVNYAYAAPPPAVSPPGYPVTGGAPYPQQQVPVKTKQRGEGFWKGW
ncbi:hypothetical protein AXF42_Ash014982 [Apostasia shenzhenica]|uniref:Uncharacterized protein n=1 Tax=Apostasia shenzhenica TaxID=1088818 RepID=A0A2I0B2S9_9ASPA|nr:hypothetical protein AXF42_Ash014982 [Apostasia shenzhenica]